jgi:tetratricopeptide (TPR) repeat protein
MSILLLRTRPRTKQGLRECLALAALLAPSLAHAEPPRRHLVDAADFTRLATSFPEARDALERGEQALERGDVKSAVDSFERAELSAPHSALAARRHCQALQQLGERDQAIAACRRAMQREGSPLDIRALVRVLLSSPKPPTFDDLYEMTLLTSRAQKSMPRQPWGYAAQCDIARRLGDAGLLDACQQALLRVAPEHAETKRALLPLGPTDSERSAGLGWSAIALAVVFTVVDWIRRTVRRHHAARATLES